MSIRLAWLITIITFIYLIIEPLLSLPVKLDAVIYISLITLTGLSLGVIRYGLKDYIVFFIITFVISNILENTSILTGFPFGHYYYSDVLGLKLFLVPLLIAPAYFAMGYMAWTIAHILLGQYDIKPKGGNVFLIPIIAAFVMVCWDVALDPWSSTIDGKWIWLDGGSYWGVPLTNYLGWFFTVYLIFQSFSLYLSITRTDLKNQIHILPKAYWYIPCVIYIGVGYEFIYAIFSTVSKPIADHTGKIWMTGDIATSMGLVAFFTLIFIAFVGILKIKLDDKII